jgi:plasmid stabilization system protein ParE
VVLGLTWTRRALVDLQEIHDYIAKDSKRYAAVVHGRRLLKESMISPE